MYTAAKVELTFRADESYGSSEGDGDLVGLKVFELTEKDLLSGLAVNVSSAGETESEAFAPACLTVTWMHSLLSLQNTMTPSRASVEVFASAVNV